MDGTPRTHESKSINMHRYNWYNFLYSTFGKKSILLSSDLVNSVGTLQARESCSKNNWSKVADCISVFYYWKFTVIKSPLWHSLVRHPTLSVFAQFPLLFVLKVRNKIQTLLTQDHRECGYNQAQEFMQLLLVLVQWTANQQVWVQSLRNSFLEEPVLHSLSLPYFLKPKDQTCHPYIQEWSHTICIKQPKKKYTPTHTQMSQTRTDVCGFWLFFPPLFFLAVQSKNSYSYQPQERRN